MEPIQMRDLLEYRFLSQLAASPKGDRAVFTVRRAREEHNDYESDLYLYDAGAVKRLTADGKSGSPVWEDEDHILFSSLREEKDRERSEQGEPLSVWYRLSLSGGEAQRAFELPLPCRELMRLNDRLWFFLADIEAEDPDAYAMDAEARKAHLARRKEEEDYHILTDLSYRVNGEGFREGLRRALFLLDLETVTLTRLTSPEMDVPFAEKAGESILYIGSAHQKTHNPFSQLYRYTPQTHKAEALYEKSSHDLWGAYLLGKELVVLASDYQLAGLNQNPQFYRLSQGELLPLCRPDTGIGSSVGTDCRLGGGQVCRVWRDELYYIATIGSSAQLCKLDPKGRVSVCNHKKGSLDCFDITGKGTILGVGLYDMALQELYELGRGQRTRPLTQFNAAALEGKYVAQPQPLSVRSHGRRIDGWVLLPKDFDPQKCYPGVLDIHGGPKTVYGEVFYQEMQLWAGRGYFVFFCNPTGSDGRGDAFMDIRGKYGTVDYQNLMDFTDAVLAAYPQLDPQRLAVTGGSYGGFMTNWIIGHTHRFACAATQRSISNWFSFYGVSDIGPYFAADQTGGDLFSAEEQKKLWLHSPLRYVENAQTPTLFIHSDEDYRCPIDQGLQLYAALLQKGVEARFVWFKGENHDLSRSGKPKHRLKRLEEITAWIEKYTAQG